jgi:mono/diheme cytochrome c family protein
LNAPEIEPPVDLLAGVDLEALALERAIARGEHLVNAIYVCAECHGADLSGGLMIDSALMGTLLGPNLTSGAGGVTAEYTPADWDRTVRHGVGRSSHALAMPSTDFMRMSDRELSDIIAYARSLPPVDNTVEPPSLGPLGTVLIATGALPLSVDLIDHHREHLRVPPEEGPTAEYGEHLAAVCTGCHREDLRGGPIEAGDPDWLAAANLTTLQDWSYDDFVTAMRDLKRPDGTDVRLPMALMAPYAARMTEVELRALWTYIETADPLPTGE